MKLALGKRNNNNENDAKSKKTYRKLSVKYYIVEEAAVLLDVDQIL